MAVAARQPQRQHKQSDIPECCVSRLHWEARRIDPTMVTTRQEPRVPRRGSAAPLQPGSDGEHFTSLWAAEVRTASRQTRPMRKPHGGAAKPQRESGPPMGAVPNIDRTDTFTEV